MRNHFIRAGYAAAFALVIGVRGMAQAPAPALSRDDIMALAKVEVAIGVARDTAQARLAQARNKTPQMQQELRDNLRTQIAGILRGASMTETQYEHETYVVSTNGDARKMFDATVAQLTGVPTPGQMPATPAGSAAQVKVPAGMVGTHIGHVMNGFSDTPNGQGLLPTAFAEARIASQHATLAARASTNLDAMKLHAGHVINAIDPTIVTAGPGLGYGVKKAALGVATHIDLAAKAPGASPNVVTHANHVATSARNTVARCDQIVAIAKQVQAANSATDAAALVNQLVSLTNQLVAGFDANGDGRVTWEQGEGGLQQAEEHMKLLLAGEGLGAR